MVPPPLPEGTKIEKKKQSREAISKQKLKLPIRNKSFNRESKFQSKPLSGRRKTRPGIGIFKNFKPTITFSSKNDFSCVGDFYLWALWVTIFQTPGKMIDSY